MSNLLVKEEMEVYAMVSFGHKEKEGETNANFFCFVYTGIVDAAHLLNPDIKIEWHGPNAWDPVPEIAAIEALTTRQVDGIMVTAAHTTALNPAINAALQAGIPVLTFDADAPASQRLAFVGTNNYNAGYVGGQKMAEWLNGQGDVAVSSIPDADHLNERLRGFTAAMARYAPASQVHVSYERFEFVVDANEQVDASQIRDVYLRLVQAHPQVRGFFATYAAPGLGAVAAVEELGLRETYILPFDVDEVLIQFLERGKIQGIVNQDPYLMGYVAMILTHAARHADPLPSPTDRAWKIDALQNFLTSRVRRIDHNTAVKLQTLVDALRVPDNPVDALDTGAMILGRKELVETLSRDFATLRGSIFEKIDALNAEIDVRKHAERELRKLNEELEERVRQRTAEIARQKYILDTFLASVPDSIYFKDRDSRILQVNESLAARFGLRDPEEAIGKTDFDLFPEKEARPKYEAEQEIIRTGRPLLAQEEPDAGGRWALTTKMPLRDEHGEIIGTFGISRDITALKQAQKEVEQAYSEISLLNVRLQEENLRMSAELHVARRLQAMVLPAPAELAGIPGLDIVGYMKPADEVGGDYYDVLSPQEGRLFVGIGDVTGHGLESGVLMLMAQTAIRTLVDRGEQDAVTFLNTLNRVLYQNIQRMNVDKSLTLAFIRYRDGQLHVIGQHEELLIIRHTGHVERVDTIDLGFPLGLQENITPWIAEAIVTLESGDGVVLYTDGITEAENIAGELYGLDRLCDVLRRHYQQSVEDIKQAIINDVLRHVGKQKVYDDLTLVVLKQQ